jgi:serine/threonine protein phosphatase PrpC
MAAEHTTQPDSRVILAPLKLIDPWQGSTEQYVVGDPGRAASRTVPLPDPEHWDRHDTIVDGVALTNDRIPIGELRAASVRGLAHRHYGRVRQDEYGYRRTPDGRYLVLCVADGVSSGRQSHRAAVTAARKGTDHLVSLLTTAPAPDIAWPVFIGHVADLIVRSGRKQLKLLGVPDAEGFTPRQVADHLATTVLYAVVDLQADDGSHSVDLVAVGDTSAWVLRRSGAWEPLQAVKNEGAAVYSPVVSALPVLSAQPPLPMRTRIDAGDVLVLMSDGIGDALCAGNGDVGRFLAEVWRTPPSPLAFAAQAEFARKSFDDDRTAVAFWPAVRS